MVMEPCERTIVRVSSYGNVAVECTHSDIGCSAVSALTLLGNANTVIMLVGSTAHEAIDWNGK